MSDTSTRAREASDLPASSTPLPYASARDRGPLLSAGARRVLYRVALALTVLLAAWLRLSEARNSALAADEFWSLTLSTGRGSVHLQTPEGVLLSDLPAMTSMVGAKPWWVIPGTLFDVTHPPGYFTLLGLWRTVVGGSDFAARLLSVLLSLAGLSLFFIAMRRWTGSGVALCALALLAVGRPSVEMGSAARPYALECFGAALALAGFALLPRRPFQAPGVGVGIGHGLDWTPALRDEETGHRLPLAMLFGGSLVLVFTHYFAAGAVFGLLIAAGLLPVALRRQARLAIGIPCILLAVAWGPMIYTQWAGGRFSSTDENTLFLNRMDASFAPVVRLVAHLPAKVLHTPRPATATVDWVLGLLWITPFVMWRRVPALRPLLLFGAGAAVIPIALDLFRRTEHLRQVRYVILASFTAAALVAAFPLLLPRDMLKRPIVRWSALGVSLAVLVLAGLSVSSAFADNQAGYPVRNPVIERQIAPGEPLLFLGREFPAMLPRTFMLEYGHTRGDRSPRPTMVAHLPVSAETRAQLARHIAEGRHVWAFTTAPDCVPEVLPGWHIARWTNLVEFGIVCDVVPDGAGPASRVSTTRSTPATRSASATRVSSPVP